MKRWRNVLGVLVILGVSGVALTQRGRLLPEALSLLLDVWSVGRQGTAVGEAAGRMTFEYRGPDGSRRVSDLYCDPGRPPEARLLMVHGLVDAGKDDTRLQALGHAFARHRVAVMVPDFPGMKALRAGPGDILEVASALEALHRVDSCAVPAGETASGGPAGGHPSGRSLQTGVVGFSYSAGPALLALDRGGRRADFAVLFGGYYDLSEVLLFLTTGRYRDRGVDYGGEALPAGRWILLAANADVLAGPPDAALLQEIAARKRQDPAADVSELVRRLGPEARAGLALVTNEDPGRFPALLEETAPAFREVLARLSPSKSLSRPLDVDLYILHGRSDAIVPYTQSLSLARGVRTHGSVRLALLGGFRHARPGLEGEGAGWRAALQYPEDSLRIMGILMAILERRGRNSLTDDGTDRR